ncbi:p-loop NTPase [Aratus pisonii nudivirus]|nr:p-loop NTPase [Aratus pisonii nudivirus]
MSLCNKRLHEEFNEDKFLNVHKKGYNVNSSDKLSTSYWLSMGLYKSKLARPLFKSETQIILEKCIREDILNINKEFFTNTSNVKVPIISLDGTCCTGKSTLCNKHLCIKTNQFLSSVGMNTNPSSALGYIYSSLKMMRNFVVKNKEVDNKLVMSDRTAWNNILWSCIWKIIAIMNNDSEDNFWCNTTSQNAYTYLQNIKRDYVYSDTILNLWTTIIDNVHTNILNAMVTSTVHVFIVDSNESNVKLRLKNRATGKDLERSEWESYIAIQNFAYAYIASKYPKEICIVDISRYECNHKDVMNILNDILEEKFLGYNKHNNIHLEFDEDSSHMFVCENLNIDGINHERSRPFMMDNFCSNIKYAYEEYRNDQVLSKNDLV